MYREIEKELAKFQRKQLCYPLVDNDDIRTTREHFIFYCLEVVQWNAGKPGQLYLFGKTYDSVNKCYGNCCVTIKYCHQRFYFLLRRNFYNDPSRKVTWKDVFDEVCDTVIPQLETQEVHFRKVRKKYAFDEYIPEEGDYLEIKCLVGNYKLKNVPGNTYSKILGIKRNSFIETFLLERSVKGPSWLQISNYVRFSSGTNCSINIECYRIEDVAPIELHIIPPIILMGLDIKKARNEFTGAEEIVCISAVIEVHSDFGTKEEASYIDHFCIISDGCSRYGDEKLKRLEKYPHTKIFVTTNEDHLLHTLIGQVANYEPDLLYGHTILSKYFANYCM